MKKYIEELKRRNVIKAAIGYIVASWLVLQVFSIVLPAVAAPDWVLKTIMLLLVICFPIWIVFSWIYEVTPDGLKKTADVSEEQSISSTTNKRLNIFIISALVLLIAITLFKPNTSSLYPTSNKEFAIAVLPFDDMSAKKDSEWFCDGMTEDILTHLSKIKGLKVVSRTSTERYKNTDKTVPQIADELGVSYVVEGSVRKHNDDVLITAQLINADDEHIWADNFNEKMKDVFKVQGVVSKKIVQQLKISISPEEEEVLNEAPTQNIKAYEAFLRGRNLFEKIDAESIKSSVDFFEKAIELDPNYADAYAELAFAKMILNPKTPEDLKLIPQYLDKALELNPNSSRANSYMGVYLYFANVDKEKAISYLDKAIELNPNDAKAHDMIAAYYSDVKTGNPEENMEKALYHSNQSIIVNPFSTQSYFLKIMTLLNIGRIAEAEEFFIEHKGKFNDDTKFNVVNTIVLRKIQATSKGPKMKEIEICEAAIKKYPFASSRIYRLLGIAYDGVTNNQDAYLKFTKMGFELEPTYAPGVAEYHTAMVESGLFKEAEEFRKTDAYKESRNRTQMLSDWQYAEYHAGNYKKSLTLIMDSLKINQGRRLALIYAKMGETEKFGALMKTMNDSDQGKALTYAAAGNRDSLFHYLNKVKIGNLDAKFPNSRSELDPYRNDPAYITYLKKHKFPIDQQIK